MKNISDSEFKKLANSLLRKFVFLLSCNVWLPVMPSVTNYHFTWCSVVINVIFDT
jgi:hypothetical protein